MVFSYLEYLIVFKLFKFNSNFSLDGARNYFYSSFVEERFVLSWLQALRKTQNVVLDYQALLVANLVKTSLTFAPVLALVKNT